MLVAAISMSVPVDALACTGIYVGKDLTTTGDTFAGRTEDFGCTCHEKYFDVVQGKDGGLRYTVMQDHPDYAGEEEPDLSDYAFQEAGINEKGVCMSATVTTDANDTVEEVDPAVEDPVINEGNMVEIVLGHANNAKEGCELLGKAIDEKGIGDTCYFQSWIADKDGCWMFAAVSGHQWVAFKCQDDVISVNPNMGILNWHINLDDTENVIHSEDLVKFAKDNGIDKYFEDESFDVFGSYGGQPGSGCLSRLYQGVHYFDPELADTFNIEMDPDNHARGGEGTIDQQSLFFTPKNGEKYDTYTILRSLATRGDGTKFDSNKDIKWGKDKKEMETEECEYWPVGNNTQLEEHFFQIRHDELPEGLQIIQWQSFAGSDFGIYLPLYSQLITEAPEVGAKQPIDHCSESPLTALENSNLYYTMLDINRLARQVRYNAGEEALTPLRAYLETVQKGLIDDQVKIEKAMVNAEDKTAAANLCAKTLFDEENKNMTVVLNELRQYVEAGDWSEPFKPSVDGTFEYASALIGEDGNFKADLTQTAAETPKESSNMPAIIGGVALVAVVVYFIKKKQD